MRNQLSRQHRQLTLEEPQLVTGRPVGLLLGEVSCSLSNIRTVNVEERAVDLGMDSSAVRAAVEVARQGSAGDVDSPFATVQAVAA